MFTDLLWVFLLKFILLSLQCTTPIDANQVDLPPYHVSVLAANLSQGSSSRLPSLQQKKQQQQQREKCGILNEKYLYNRERITAFDEYPWTGRVSYKNANGERIFRCLGVLINKRHLIAPAHCVLDTGSLEAYSVVFGDWNATDDISQGDCNALGECAPPPQEYELAEIAVHPNYSSKQHDNDIAVFKFTKDVSYTDYVQPICLHSTRMGRRTEDANGAIEGGNNGNSANGGNYIGEWLQCVGFPARSLFSNAKVKQKAIVHMTSRKHCQQIYKVLTDVSDNQICGYIKSDVNFMAGSALMGVNVTDGEPDNFYLIGIATVGSREKNYDVPDMFMRIEPYKDWILDNSN